MKLGLIGNTLGHSWSPEIHTALIGCDYGLWQMPEEELDRFFAERDFDGINVTIPYKRKVLEYLDETDGTARALGAVNCIVNRNGRLTGSNTDLAGFMAMMEHSGIDVTEGKTAVLGSGGAASACMEGIRRLGGTPVMVSRNPKGEAISYETLYEQEASIRVIVNATPVGMRPGTDGVPVDLCRFHHLRGVADIVANPLCTRLRFEARCLGLPNAGGFEMLVRQAAEADRLFTGHAVPEEKIRACMRRLAGSRQNIVLIGMPTCGKTTLAEMIAARTGRPLVEMDDILVERLGMSIRECFERFGESCFREAETQLARDLRQKEGIVISCGGGVIKNRENMRYLSENGMVIWIDRDPSLLYPTQSRPLSADEDAVRRLYGERRHLYDMYSDIRVENNGSIGDTLEEVLKMTGE